jgi:hypothetical protein
MRIKGLSGLNQAVFLLAVFFLVAFKGCKKSNEEIPVIPPVTHPLVRDYIGYGVVTVSFAHLLNEPGSAGISNAYLRRGTVVRITQRRPLVSGTATVFWVLVEGNYEAENISSGWLEETTVDIYDSESRAFTASRTLNQ